MEKHDRRNVVVATIGFSSLPHMIEQLVDDAHGFVSRSKGQMSRSFALKNESVSAWNAEHSQSISYILYPVSCILSQRVRAAKPSDFLFPGELTE